MFLKTSTKQNTMNPTKKKHNPRHLLHYYLNWIGVILFIFFIGTKASCQDNTYDGTNPTVKPKTNYIGTPISINVGIGRYEKIKDYGSNREVLSLSIELEYRIKAGFIQLRKNEETGTAAMHVNIIHHKNLSLSGGVAMQQTGEVIKTFPEIGFLMVDDDFCNLFTRLSWHEVIREKRLGFMFGISFKLLKK